MNNNKNIIENNQIHFTSQIKLNHFQLQILSKMVNRENNYCVKIVDKPRVTLHTNISILGSEINSGKTMIILGLILYKNNLIKYSTTLYFKNTLYSICNLPKDIIDIIAEYAIIVRFQAITYSDYAICKNNLLPNNLCCHCANDIFINTNLIIVPPSLFFQWKKNIINNTNLKVKYLQNKKHFDFTKKDVLNEYFEQFDIVLCTTTKLSTLYNINYDTLHNIYSVDNNNYVWKRAIIDEAQSSFNHYRYFPFIKSYFMWMVTSKYKKLNNTENYFDFNSKWNIFKKISNNLTCKIDCQNHIVTTMDIINSLRITCNENSIKKNLQLSQIKYKTKYFKDNFFILFFSQISFLKNNHEFFQSLNNLHHEKSVLLFMNIMFPDLKINNKDYFTPHTAKQIFTNLQYCLWKPFAWPILIITHDSFNKQEIKNNLSLLFIVFLIKKFLFIRGEILYIYRNASFKTYKSVHNPKKLFFYFYTCVQALYEIHQIILSNQLCIFCYTGNLAHEINLENYICNKCKPKYSIQNFNFLYIFILLKRTLDDTSFSSNYFAIQQKMLQNECFKILHEIATKLKNKILPVDLLNKYSAKNLGQLINYNTFNSKINYVVNEIKSECNQIKSARNQNKSYLIFCDNFELFDKIKIEFDGYNISYIILKGNANFINKQIQKYNEKKKKVLLLNPEYFVEGLNLQTTDILFFFNKINNKQNQQQIIQKAYGYGYNRNRLLIVQYVLYENET